MVANVNMSKLQLSKQFPLVSGKELYKMIKLRTNYKLYEIEDILLGLATVTSELLANNQSVEIPYIVSIFPKINEPKAWVSPKTGETITSKGSKTIIVRKSDFLMKNLNPKE